MSDNPAAYAEVGSLLAAVLEPPHSPAAVSAELAAEAAPAA
jgi:hypothetical protein